MIPPDAKLVFKGILFDVYQWEQEQFDGTKKTFEKLKRNDGVNIIPVLDDGRILLIEESQPGRGTYLTTPGGQVNPGETAEEGGRREFLEETGYTASEMTKWLTVMPYGNKIDWTIDTYIARGCVDTGTSHPDSGEKISLKPVTLDEFFDIAMDDRKFRNVEITLEFLRALRVPDGLAKLKKLFLHT